MQKADKVGQFVRAIDHRWYLINPIKRANYDN